MPIKRNSDQKSKTLEEFYGELILEDKDVLSNEIVKAMLLLIEIFDQEFKKLKFVVYSHLS